MARAHSLLALLIVAAIGASGCVDGNDPAEGAVVPPTAEARADAPTLKVGDEWVERSVGGGHERTETIQVAKIEDVEVGGAAVKVYRVTSDAGTTVWLRKLDLALIRSHTESGAFAMDIVYERPCVETEWPLVVGAKWSVQCEGTRTMTSASARPASDRFTRSGSYEVTAIEDVQVKAGTFTAFRIEWDLTMGEIEATGTTWYAENACHAVKTVRDSQQMKTTVELQSRRCGAG